MAKKIKDKKPKKQFANFVQQRGEPYSALKFKMDLEKGEVVVIKGLKFMVRKVRKRDILLGLHVPPKKKNVFSRIVELFSQ